MIDLTGIAVTAIGLIFNFLLAILGKAIVPKLKEWLSAKASTETRKALWELTVQLVEAAEQIIGRGNGSEKYAYVESRLIESGMTIDGDMIEAAVHEMKNRSLSELQKAFVPEESESEKDSSESEIL